MRHRRSVTPLIIIALLIIFLAAAIAAFVIPQIVLPFAEDYLTKKIGHRVTIGSLSLDRRLMLVAHNIAFSLKETDKPAVIIHSAGTKLDIKTIIQENTFIPEEIAVSGLTVDHPVLAGLTKDTLATIRFKDKSVNIQASSGSGTLSCSVEYGPDGALTIEELTIRSGSSHIIIGGTIDGSKDHTADLVVTSRITPEDAVTLAPSIGPMVEKLKLDGRFETENARIRGSLSGIQGINIESVVRIPDLRVYDQRFDDARISIRLRNGLITIDECTAAVYSGKLQAKVRCDIGTPSLPFAFAVVCNDVNFADIIQMTGLRDKGINGTFESTLWLEGFLKDQKSYVGEMYLHVENGNLGPLPLFNPALANISFVLKYVIPGYKRTLLTESAGNFTIKNRRVMTGDLIGWGETASVYARGYVDFDGNLDLLVENNFSEGLANGAGRWSESIRNIVSSAGDSISKGRLYGKISKPEYESTSVTNFSKFFDSAVDLISDIF
ncbi:MAG: hypothetical protein ABIJ27_07690 [Candidatus Omnitrophota bacterium]